MRHRPGFMQQEHRTSCWPASKVLSKTFTPAPCCVRWSFVGAIPRLRASGSTVSKGRLLASLFCRFTPICQPLACIQGHCCTSNHGARKAAQMPRHKEPAHNSTQKCYTGAGTAASSGRMTTYDWQLAIRRQQEQQVLPENIACCVYSTDNIHNDAKLSCCLSLPRSTGK